MQRAVGLQWEVGALNGLSQSLMLLGWSASLRAYARRAAWLHGAEEELRERIGAPAAWTSWSWMAPPPWMPRGERALSLVREALGERAFKSAWNDGRTTPLEEVLAGVLEYDSTTSPEHREHSTAGPRESRH